MIQPPDAFVAILAMQSIIMTLNKLISCFQFPNRMRYVYVYRKFIKSRPNNVFFYVGIHNYINAYTIT